MIATDPGFEPANLVRLKTLGLNENEIGRLQQSISTHPLVTSCLRTHQGLGSSNSIKIKDSSGRVIDGVNYFQVDGSFLKTVGLKLLYGKPLYPNPIQGDVIVNEAFQKHLMSSEPIGQVIEPADERSKSRVFGSGINGRIVGVVKDFRFQSLRHTVSPTMITIVNEPSKWSHITGEILIRVREDSAEAFGAYLKELWKDLKIGGLLRFSYVEDERRTFYAKEISWSKIVSGASFVCCPHRLNGCCWA